MHSLQTHKMLWTKHLEHFIQKHENLCFFVLCAINILCLWPGRMEPDSLTALSLAKSGVNIGHIPPFYTYFYSFLWPDVLEQRGIYAIQMLLMWSGVFVYGKRLKNPWTKIVLYLMPFFPNILSCSRNVLREGHYSFALLLMGALLIDRKRSFWWSFLQLGSALFLLTYAVFMKYQVKFLVPICIFWILWRAQLTKSVCINIGMSLVLSLGFISVIDHVNNVLLNYKKNETYSWKYTKIYDLASISLYTNQFLLPDFLKRNTEINVNDLREHYTNAWESLIVYPNSPLRSAQTEEERKILYTTWVYQVLSYPFAYLKSRCRMLTKMLTSSSVRGLIRHELSEYYPFAFHFGFLGYLFAFIFQLPFVFLYLVVGWRVFNRHRLAPTLFFNALITLSYLGIICFLTLAAVSRYLYLCEVLTFMSHPLGLQIWLDLKKPQNLKSL